MMKTICLNMIVKNESAVIKRCLDSVKKMIDYWVICDTGSTDNTPQLIAECLFDIPGELHQKAWVNFGHNRNEALELARGKADYLLFLDADMVALIEGQFKHLLTADAYLIKIEEPRPYLGRMLVSQHIDWRYVGVTYEYLTCQTLVREEKLNLLTLNHLHDGGMRSQKLSRDIELLTKGLEEQPTNGRYLYYLARSYQSMQAHQMALSCYQKRLTLGGEEQERWSSMYQIARLLQTLGRPWEVVLEAFLRAYELGPSRAEPLYQIAKHYREQKQYHTAYLFAKKALEIPPPEETLPVEASIYEYKLPLEVALLSHFTARLPEAMRLYNQLLANPSLPGSYRQLVKKNRQLILEQLEANKPVVEVILTDELDAQGNPRRQLSQFTPAQAIICWVRSSSDTTVGMRWYYRQQLIREQFGQTQGGQIYSFIQSTAYQTLLEGDYQVEIYLTPDKPTSVHHFNILKYRPLVMPMQPIPPHHQKFSQSPFVEVPFAFDEVWMIGRSRWEVNEVKVVFADDENFVAIVVKTSANPGKLSQKQARRISQPIARFAIDKGYLARARALQIDGQFYPLDEIISVHLVNPLAGMIPGVGQVSLLRIGFNLSEL